MNSRASGFSSIEVLLSLLLLGILSVVLFWGVFHVRVSHHQSLLRENALGKAEEGLEIIHSFSKNPEMRLSDGVFYLILDGDSWRLLENPLDDIVFQRRIMISPWDAYWLVRSEVVWTGERSRQNTTSLFTLVPRMP